MLRRLVQILFVFLLILIVAFGLFFTAENNTMHTVKIFSYESPPLQLGLWLLISLFMGVLLGWMLSKIRVNKKLKS